MLVKRYHANDMQQAMDTVIKELGADAVILNSRKVRKKGFKNLFKKPILEVMVAYDPANTPAVKKINASYGGYGAYGSNQEPKKDPVLGAGQAKDAGAPQNPGPLQNLSPSQSSGPPKNPGQPQKIELGQRIDLEAIKAQPPGVSLGSSEQIERLDKRIDSIDAMLSDFIEKFSFVKRDITYDYPDDVQELMVRMIENQVREELAHSLAKEAELMLRKKQDTSAAEVLEHLVLEILGRAEPIMHKKFTQKVILVLGPTGVGKTTTIVKLAADFSVKQKKKVGIINTDTFRIGAQEQLQSYADILGIPLHVTYLMEELEEALEAMSDRDMIFVDTAGKRPGDEQHREDILNMIRILKPEDTFLCLAATTGFASIKEMVDTYGFVEEYKILVTKLDETKYRGQLLNLSWYTHKPLAYVTTGQNVPDDIEVVNMDSITKQIIYNNNNIANNTANNTNNTTVSA